MSYEAVETSWKVVPLGFPDCCYGAIRTPSGTNASGSDATEWVILSPALVLDVENYVNDDDRTRTISADCAQRALAEPVQKYAFFLRRTLRSRREAREERANEPKCKDWGNGCRLCRADCSIWGRTLRP